MLLQRSLLALPQLFACVAPPPNSAHQAPPPTSPAFTALAGVVIPAGTRMMARSAKIGSNGTIASRQTPYADLLLTFTD